MFKALSHLHRAVQYSLEDFVSDLTPRIGIMLILCELAN